MTHMLRQDGAAQQPILCQFPDCKDGERDNLSFMENMDRKREHRIINDILEREEAAFYMRPHAGCLRDM